MLSIVYVSSASREFSQAELVGLLTQSQEKNLRLGITGMLLYKDGNFIQVIEGPDDVVENMFKTIVADERHRGVLRLLDENFEERQFPDWSMGFRNLNDPAVRQMEGYNEFMNESLDPETFRADESRGRRLLELFRSNMTS